MSSQARSCAWVGRRGRSPATRCSCPDDGDSRQPTGTTRRGSSTPSCRGRARDGRTLRRPRGSRRAGARGPSSCPPARRPRQRRRPRRSRSGCRARSVVMASSRSWCRHVLPRPVGVDLDAQAVGVRQIERLADQMIGHADANAQRRQMRREAPERGAVRQQDREVIEAERPRGARW